jgi:CubicO group peptidase (beta-lactamase class C family)
MNTDELQSALTEAALRLDVPGAAMGVYLAGQEHYAFHGVTNVENPLPVDADTLFQFGSTGKTFTATAMLRLVDQGLVDLDAPVRTYLPEFRLKDEDVAARVTILQLFNHTAGWAGDMMDNTGDGDDALAKYVAKMVEIDQVSPLGATVSYNNASLSVAGLVISKVTGKTYEQALKELIFVPLGLDHCFFFPNDIMTRRFVAGHTQHPDGRITVARPWALPRGNSPAGGISSNAGDQIAWARFHLGDGCAADGTRVLSAELLDRMKKPTASMAGSALGDAVGISWLLYDVNGVRFVTHGGTTNGHHSSFVMVPERDFAIALLTNCGPNGPQLNDELLKHVLESGLGIVDRVPEPTPRSESELVEFTGRYETIAAWADVTSADGHLVIKVVIKPEMLAQLREDDSDFDEEQPPIPVGLLEGDGDRYIVTDGPAKGMKGYFARSAAGEVEAIHVGGRLATKTSVTAQV